MPTTKSDFFRGNVLKKRWIHSGHHHRVQQTTRTMIFIQNVETNQSRPEHRYRDNTFNKVMTLGTLALCEPNQNQANNAPTSEHLTNSRVNNKYSCFKSMEKHALSALRTRDNMLTKKQGGVWEGKTRDQTTNRHTAYNKILYLVTTKLDINILQTTVSISIRLKHCRTL